LLGDGDVSRTLAEQAQRTLAEGTDPRAAQALGILAVALGQTGNPASPDETPNDGASPLPETASSPSPTLNNPGSDQEESPAGTALGTSPAATDRTPLATGTPLPTRTPTATPGSPFVILDQAFDCDQDITENLLRVFAEDADGDPLPGSEVVVTWEAGEDHFFTGLKPELGEGYADFLMTPGVMYTLHMAAGGEIIPDLTAAECETPGGARYWGSWLVVFTQQ
jgi:hypothetical protein